MNHGGTEDTEMGIEGRMKVFCFALSLCLLAQDLHAKPKITVLDVKVQGKGALEDYRDSLGELLRASVGAEVAGRLLLMDKESLYEILKDADINQAQCSEAECEVDLFRRMQADFGITPVLLQVGRRLKLLLKLHQASNGEVLKVVELYGTNLAELDRALQQKIGELVEPVLQGLERGVFGKVEAKISEEQGGTIQFKKVEAEVLTFLSAPPQADLFIDGRLIGTTGKNGSKQPLPFGRHKVRVELANYLPLEQVLEVTKGMQNKNITLTLESSLREVVLASTPEQGAEVYLGGTLVGKTPHRITLPIGKYELRLTRELHLPLKEIVTITREIQQGRQLEFALTPNYGLLDLRTIPPGIAVFIDEEQVGVTPLEGYRLRLGVHDVALRDPRYFAISIEELQFTTPLERVQKDFTLKQKFGGLDISAHDENNSMVVAEVFLNGKKVGETEPRVQIELPIGRYRLEVKTSHRTMWDSFEIKEHGEMYQQDLLLHSLTDAELAAIETERLMREKLQQLILAQKTEASEFQRIGALRRPKNLILYPALLVGLCAGGGSVYLTKAALADKEQADLSLKAYSTSHVQSEMHRQLEQARDSQKKARWKFIGAAVLGGNALVAFGVTLYEAMQLPPWPARRYTMTPVIDSGVFGLAMERTW